jgi:hypothetical protein
MKNEIHTITEWARRENIPTSSAISTRKRLGIGKRDGAGSRSTILLNEQEWKKVKKNIKSRGKIDIADAKKLRDSNTRVVTIAKKYKVTRQAVYRALNK